MILLQDTRIRYYVNVNNFYSANNEKKEENNDEDEANAYHE